MLTLSVKANVRDIERTLDDLARKQVPFAVAQALTATARDIKPIEQKGFDEVLDRPTPFTRNAVTVIPARKDFRTAVVLVKDITASYLQPYEQGGMNKINKRALMVPINQPKNRYGNLPDKVLAKRLKGRKDVFIGPVQTKSGEVRGVWQRVRATKKEPSHLKLLIRFEDAHPTKPILKFGDRARKAAQERFPVRFNEAMAKALATAK